MKLSSFKFEQLSISKLQNVMGGESRQETSTVGSTTVSMVRDSDSGSSDSDGPFDSAIS